MCPQACKLGHDEGTELITCPGTALCVPGGKTKLEMGCCWFFGFFWGGGGLVCLFVLFLKLFCHAKKELCRFILHWFYSPSVGNLVMSQWLPLFHSRRLNIKAKRSMSWEDGLLSLVMPCLCSFMMHLEAHKKHNMFAHVAWVKNTTLTNKHRGKIPCRWLGLCRAVPCQSKGWKGESIILLS